ncbi:MAG: TonB family protein [bacterium]
MTHRCRPHNLEQDYDRDLRLAMVAALALVIAGFLALKPAPVVPYRPHSAQVYAFDRPANLDLVVPAPPVPRVRPRLPVAAPDGGDADPGITTGDRIFERPRPEPGYVEVPLGVVIERPPSPLNLPKPAYPELCRAAGISGRVVVKLLVEPDSSVSRAELLKGSGSSLLDEAALAAARQARFRPGAQGIQPVRVWVAIPYDFRLD